MSGAQLQEKDLTVPALEENSPFKSQHEAPKREQGEWSKEKCPSKGKALSTPLPAYLKLSKNDCPKSVEEKAEMAKIPYASACGSLMYAMVATRPDIAHAVGVVSKFMSNPGKKHWDAVKSILRYLSGTADRQLRYGGGDLSIKG
ncbi:hypothetical protein L7F22_062326 [Adiantum nelumboides]|nr:hypothetical protein [Adiantum nelumboides]